MAHKVQLMQQQRKRQEQSSAADDDDDSAGAGNLPLIEKDESLSWPLRITFSFIQIRRHDLNSQSKGRHTLANYVHGIRTAIGEIEGKHTDHCAHHHSPRKHDNATSLKLASKGSILLEVPVRIPMPPARWF